MDNETNERHEYMKLNARRHTYNEATLYFNDF